MCHIRAAFYSALRYFEFSCLELYFGEQGTSYKKYSEEEQIDRGLWQHVRTTMFNCYHVLWPFFLIFTLGFVQTYYFIVLRNSKLFCSMFQNSRFASQLKNLKFNIMMNLVCHPVLNLFHGESNKPCFVYLFLLITQSIKDCWLTLFFLLCDSLICKTNILQRDLERDFLKN